MRKQHYLIMVILTILNLLVRRSFSVGGNRIFALLITVCLILSLNLKSQVAVNTNGADANSSAMLDVSSTEKGILIPRMTLSQRNDISNPVTGLMIYQTNNTPGFYFYNGSNWVVVGDGATSINSLYDGVSDGSSIFLGNGSGVSDDGTSNQNLGYGISALNANTNGYENTAIGIEALKLTTEGHHNTALGIHSLSAITTGSGNTALGTNAGISNIGSGNIFIGANAAYNELGSNKLYIENSASSTPLIYGDFSSDLLRVNGTLDINNAYQLPTSDGTIGQTLKTDGSGSLTWSDDTNTGATSINELSDAATDNNSLFLGIDAGANDDGTTNFNTGTGVWSLKEVTEGSHNSALGTTALQQLTTGSQNTAFGMGALNSVTTNSNNTAIGKEAGKDVTGSGNVFIGNEAAKTQTSISNKLFIDNSSTSTPLIYGDFSTDLLRVNGTLDISNAYQFPTSDGTIGQTLKTDGSGSLSWADDTNTGATDIDGLSDGRTVNTSVFLGSASGASNTGNHNTGIGNTTLQDNTTGDSNTGVGLAALSENITGGSNTGVGSSALRDNQTGSNNVAIGAAAGLSATGSGNIFIGSLSGSSEIGNNKLYIENSSSSTPLIYGEFDNELVKVNGDLEVTGDLDVQLEEIVDGDGDTKISVEANVDADNIRIEIGGVHCFSMSRGKLEFKNTGNSVYIGDSAGFNESFGYNLNTGIGNHSLFNNTYGKYNVAIGFRSMYSNVNGYSNTAIGFESLYSITTGDNMTAMGYESLKSNTSGHSNTAMGYKSLRINTTGHSNTAMGYESLKCNSTGHSNSAMGYKALVSNDLGTENTAIGGSALQGNTIGFSNTAIGYHALLYGSIGYNNTSVGADAGFTSTNNSLSNTGSFGYYCIVSADNYYRIGNTTVTSIGGQVGWSAYSDGRFKRNIRQDVPGLEFILKLKPVSYNWDIRKLDDFIGATEGTEKSEHMREARRQQEAKTYTGFVAQDVEKAAKEIGYDFSGVETPPNDCTPYSIRYSEFVVPLVKAVQEQQEMIEELRKEIEILKINNANGK